MSPQIAFLLGVSLMANVVLITSALTTPTAGISAPRADKPVMGFPAILRNEVIETMKTNRTLNALAFLSMFGFIGGATAQTVQSPTVAVFTDEVAGVNVKTVGGADAASQAIIARTAAQSIGLAQQNAVANQQAMNALLTKMVAQTTIISATEGSKAIETVQQSGDAANVAMALGIFSALLNSRVTSPATTP